VWKASRSSSGEGSATGSVEFKFVAVLEGDDVLNLKEGDTLTGTMTTSPDQTNLGIQYMYMQLGAAAANVENMTWVLVGCKGKGDKNCDFKSSKSVGFEAEVKREAEVVYKRAKTALRGSGKVLNLC
jgi:hypothetical protein